jgi:hypothetical protein
MSTPEQDLMRHLYSQLPPDAGFAQWAGAPLRWTMNREWYDRIRAAFCSEDQERARAAAHASAWIPASAAGLVTCPVCPAGPFASLADLSAHVAAMADPANREPAGRDYLLGFPIDVRADGGVPHLEPVP